MKPTDEVLMNAWCAGDAQALEELYNRYLKRIFSFSFRFLSNRADAEEVTADVFTVLSRQTGYSEKARFSTWIYTIARNRCLDILRRRKRWRFFRLKKDDDAENSQTDIPDFSGLPNLEPEADELRSRIAEAIRSLPEEYREVVLLREYQQLAYEEISSITGWSLGKVKVMLYRARERLRSKLLPVIEEGL